MMQYSVYARACNRESMERLTASIEKNLPEKGRVAIVSITDAQWGGMRIYSSQSQKRNEIPEQFTLF